MADDSIFPGLDVNSLAPPLHLSVEEYDDLLLTHGSGAEWRRSILCPCLRSEGHGDCPAKSGAKVGLWQVGIAFHKGIGSSQKGAAQGEDDGERIESQHQQKGR